MMTERRLKQLDAGKNAIAWLGAPTRFTSFRTVAGTVSDYQLTALGETIEEHVGEVVPQVQPDGAARQWSTMEDVAIAVSPGGAGTSITLTTDRRQDIVTSAVVFAALAFVLTVVGLKLLSASGVAAVGGVLAASTSASWLAFRLYWKRSATNWQRRLDGLGSIVAAQVERLAADREHD
ncbi:MAG: hypothetical protein JSW51_08035 [Gemmatimonadota bacterium]|nr:MAG: hypothetical protein JSW51_08035 [Gemmatimonadota bacterium]